MERNCFEWDKWSKQSFSTKEDAIEFIRDTHCIGKKLQTIRTIGPAYEYEAYKEQYKNEFENNALERLAKGKLIEAGFFYENMPPIDDVRLPCKVSLAAPVSLVFTDGTSLDVAINDDIMMGYNSIPLAISDSVNPRNFMIEKLIPPEMIDSTLQNVYVDHVTDRTETVSMRKKEFGEYDNHHSEQVFSNFKIRFSFHGNWVLTSQPCRNSLFSLQITGFSKVFTYHDMALADLHLPFIRIDEFHSDVLDIQMQPAKFCIKNDGTHVRKRRRNYDFEVYKDRKLALQQDDLSCYMGYLLERFYDASINRPDHEAWFDPYDDTIYPIASIRQMVDELSADLLELEKDITSPRSKEILERTHSHRLDEEIRDFYRRFIPRLQKLISVPEEYDIFVFFGN